MAQKTVLEAIRDGMAEELERDDRVVVLGEDVGKLGGVFRVTDGLLSRFGEERVIDTPLAENSIVGIAIGMALNGLHPIAEIQFADYIYPAYDQIVNEAAKIRYRSAGAYGCPLVVRTPYGAGIHGGLYHSQSVEVQFAHIPGLKVVAPSNPYDAKGLIKSSIQDEDPVIYLEHKKTYRLIKGEVPEEEYVVPLGSAKVVREGSDITVLTYGLMVHYALEAATELEKESVSVEVVDLRTLLPLDKKAVLESVRKTSKALIVYEDNLTLGYGAELAAILASEAFEDLDGPIMRVAAPDVPSMPFHPVMEDYCLPSSTEIAEALRKLAVY
ncbi:MAG: alpha-ketoacid dehydrogenase subunit beta [Dehalococcoidia bacterium]